MATFFTKFMRHIKMWFTDSYMKESKIIMGLSNNDIATILKVDVSTIHSRIYRAKRELEKEIQKESENSIDL